MGELQRMAREVERDRHRAPSQEGGDAERRQWRMVKIVYAVLALIAVAGVVVLNVSSSSNDDPEPRNPPPAAVTNEQQLVDLMEQLVLERMQLHYSGVGLQLSEADWDDLSGTVCDDMRAAGSGYYTTGDISTLTDEEADRIAEAAWSALAFQCYPDSYQFTDSQMDAAVSFNASIAVEAVPRAEALGLDLGEPSVTTGGTAGGGITGYAGDSSGYGPRNYSGGGYTNYTPQYTSPYPGGGSTGGGYRVQCSDGSFSNSGGKQGACSHHGGVR